MTVSVNTIEPTPISICYLYGSKSKCYMIASMSIANQHFNVVFMNIRKNTTKIDTKSAKFEPEYWQLTLNYDW